MPTKRRLLVWDSPVAHALASNDSSDLVGYPVYDSTLDVVTPDGSLNEFHLRNVSSTTVKYAGHASTEEELELCQSLRRKWFVRYCYMMDRRNRARNLDIYSMDELFRIHTLVFLRYFAEKNITHVIMGSPSTGYDLIASEVIRHTGGKPLFVLQLHYGRFAFSTRLEEIHSAQKDRQIFQKVQVEVRQAPVAPWYLDTDSYETEHSKASLVRASEIRRAITVESEHLRGPMGGDKKLKFLRVVEALLDQNYRRGTEKSSLAAQGRVATTSPATGKNSKICLFALSVQPEASTSQMDDQWENPVYCVDKLLTLLPPDWQIWIRPHPNQASGFRSTLFWDSIRVSDRVQVVAPSERASEFFSTVALVATLNGTIGWEALNQGVPVLIFGSAWYEGLPGVIHVDDAKSVADIPQAGFWQIPAVEAHLTQLSGQLAPGFINHLDYVSARDMLHSALGKTHPLENNETLLLETITAILDYIDKG